MTKTNTTMWLPEPITLPCEHRLFQATDHGIRRSLPRGLRVNEEFGAWAVADNSGDTPDTTDDGIFWLNMTTNIKVGNDGHATVPVMDPAGDISYFITNAAGVFVLSERFRWNVNVYPGNIYRAIRL